MRRLIAILAGALMALIITPVAHATTHDSTVEPSLDDWRTLIESSGMEVPESIEAALENAAQSQTAEETAELWEGGYGYARAESTDLAEMVVLRYPAEIIVELGPPAQSSTARYDSSGPLATYNAAVEELANASEPDASVSPAAIVVGACGSPNATVTSYVSTPARQGNMQGIRWHG